MNNQKPREVTLTIRYEVFWKEEWINPQHRGWGFIDGFTDKSKAEAYAKQAADGWGTERPRDVIICEVSYKPIKEYKSTRSEPEIIEKDL